MKNVRRSRTFISLSDSLYFLYGCRKRCQTPGIILISKTCQMDYATKPLIVNLYQSNPFVWMLVKGRGMVLHELDFARHALIRVSVLFLHEHKGLDVEDVELRQAK